MSEFDQALEKLSLSNSAEKTMESLQFLHHFFQSGKGDATEVSIETEILTHLSNLITSHTDNVVRTEALSLLTVVSFRNSWSEAYAVDACMSLMSNMLDSKNLPLSAKVIEIAQQILETNNVASQSLTSLATLIYSLTQLLQNKESDEKTKESLLKSLLLILDKYKVEDPHAKKKLEKEKAKGRKGKEKEKEKGKEALTSSSESSSSSSSSSSAATSVKNIAPPLPVVLSELVALANTMTIEGGVFIRSHARFVLEILKEKFKVKIPRVKGGKGKGRDSSSDNDDDEKEDEEDRDDGNDDYDGDEIPKFSSSMHGQNITLSKNNRCATATSAFQSVFIDLKVKRGIHKLTFTASTTYNGHILLLGAVSASLKSSVISSYIGGVTGRAGWYTFQNLQYAYLPNSSAQTPLTGKSVPGGAGSTITVTMEYNADKHTIGFQLAKKPELLIKNVPADAELGLSIQYGSVTITRYEELDEPTFSNSKYTVM